MRNRLVKQRRLILVAACVFAAASMFLPGGAQAAGLTYEVTAVGDHIFVSQTTDWVAGTHDLSNIPPLNCAGEVLQGAHSTKVLGGGSYQSTAVLDATDIMLYQYQTDADVGGIYRDSFYIDSFGTPWVTSLCGPMPDDEGIQEATAYCSMASVQSLAMGNDLSITSRGAAVQADINVSDSLASEISIRGDGMGRINLQSVNMAGIGNSTALGYENRMEERVLVYGHDMQLSSRFNYESFADLWVDLEEEGEES